MKIITKESTMIRPAKDFPHEHLWASNVDLLYERTFIYWVYLFKSNDSSSNSFETKSLKDAMSKVLVQFYPLAGRMGRDDNGRLVINCNNEGVLFIEAETDCAIDDLGDFMRNVEIMKLIPTVDASNNISSVPPFISQLDDLTPVMRGPTSSQCPNLNITDWINLPFYEADFGMGKPGYVMPAYPPEGIGYILATPLGHDDGSRALVICLEKDHMESFKKLFYALQENDSIAMEKMVATSTVLVTKSHLQPVIAHRRSSL